MERGLMWLPLLVTFIWLAWQGWNEYQKIETYREWAQQFERSKYDIYAILGQNGSDLTWGKPTRSPPLNLVTFSLHDVDKICLLVDDKAVDIENPPNNGKSIYIEFQCVNPKTRLKIPFTEISLAVEWEKHLQRQLETLSAHRNITGFYLEK